MTDEKLNNNADALFALFNRLPNTKERAMYFGKWIILRNEQSLRLYKNET